MHVSRYQNHQEVVSRKTAESCHNSSGFSCLLLVSDWTVKKNLHSTFGTRKSSTRFRHGIRAALVHNVKHKLHAHMLVNTKIINNHIHYFCIQGGINHFKY
uniref:Uncharacterized protein n=1 Tax=Cacopsylla melanoneura TaxID=428564 RepID=A0A8D8ZED6_9HEMI